MSFIFSRLGKMPRPLLLLSVAPVVVMALFSFSAALPGFRIVAFGSVISSKVWWATGGGFLTLVGFVIFFVPLWMLVFRKPFSRTSLVAAWLFFSIFSYFVIPDIAMHVNENVTIARAKVSLPIAVTGFIIGAYLALSKDVLQFVSKRSRSLGSGL